MVLKQGCEREEVSGRADLEGKHYRKGRRPGVSKNTASPWDSRKGNQKKQDCSGWKVDKGGGGLGETMGVACNRVWRWTIWVTVKTVDILPKESGNSCRTLMKGTRFKCMSVSDNKLDTGSIINHDINYSIHNNEMSASLLYFWTNINYSD